MSITPKELADKVLGEYRIKGNEINVKECPFCKPQSNDNLWKFYVNLETGVYDCKRKNKCNASGSFYELCKFFNLEDKINKNDYTKTTKKKEVYKKPKVELENIKSKVIKKYLKARDLSKKTIDYCDLKEKDNKIVFEYYQNNELVMIKYRTLKGKKIWKEKGGKPVLWQMDKCNTDQPLVITEGEFDTMAIIESGIKNVASVPMGNSNTKWIENCWDFIEQFKKIIIWPDNDQAGKKMQKEIIKRLGRWRCYIVNSDYKDANEHLHNEGKKSVKKAINNCEGVPIKRLLQLKDIETFDPTDIESIKSNIPLVNKYMGGYMMGMLSIWTGTNGSGKSTFINQESLSAIDQNYGTCIVSGELPHWMIRYWLELQACGAEVEIKYDEIREEESYFVPEKQKKKIRKWAEDRLFIYDSFDSLKTHDILEVFENAAKRYNVKQFIVDNLMVVNYDRNDRSSKYDKQGQFVSLMKEFAMKYNAHVHVVAHPRKTDGIVKKEDVAGLYEITNFADNVICIHRVTQDNADCFSEDEREAENILDIFKSRIYGRQNLSVRLDFEESCKRFYQYGNENDLFREYGWKERD